MAGREAIVLSVEAEQDASGALTLTRAVVWLPDDERQARYLIRRIRELEVEGSDPITGALPIMLWFREQAGIATDEDRELAGLETARINAEESSDGWSLIARGLRLPLWIDYEDRNGERTRRRITVVCILGYEVEDGRVVADRVEAYCHVRKAARRFYVDRTLAIADTETALTPMDPTEVDRWLRRKVGMGTEADDDDEVAEAQERERAAAVAGAECAVIPRKVRALIRQPGAAEADRWAEGFILGFDTDATGRPTVLFFAASKVAKRGRALYLPGVTVPDERVLCELRSAPDGAPIADPAEWVLSLPRDQSRSIPPHE
jgi:hypothetical protein